MSETIHPNQQQASSGNPDDVSRVEQTMRPGIKEMPGYLSSEAVEIKARIKPRIEHFLSCPHKVNSIEKRFTDEQ